MLIEHGIDDVDEGFITGKQCVAPSQDVTFKPAFQCVLAQHFHHTPGNIELAAVGVVPTGLCQPRLFCGGVDGGEPVRGSIVGSEDAEGAHVAAHHFGEEVCKYVGR